MMPTAMAETGTVKKIDKDGKETNEGVEEVDDDEEEEEANFEEDVWGIKKSDEGFADLADTNNLGGVYMGVTPLRNMSLLSVSVSAGLAITFVLVGILLLLMLGGVGAANPNIKKGWELLHGVQGKLVALGLVFVLALFMIIIVFFSLTIFGKVIVYMG